MLIKNATIISPASTHHQKKRDILIKKGTIIQIKARIDEKAKQTIDLKGACVSPGWLDIGVHTGDPGFEQREDMKTVTRAAAAGGYTGIVSWPNTHPVIDGRSEVLYLKNESRKGPVECFPIGAISENCEGKDITEMYDMNAAGAVAFSDGLNSIQNAGMMLRALQYVKAFDGLVINHPCDASIAGDGQIHEGLVSTSLGMKGIPHMAEEVMVQRDIYLAEYTNSRLHLANLSTAGSVELVRRAKKRGVQVTASVALMNLIFEDEVIEEFDTNVKVWPPLREATDRKALLKGIQDGTIDLLSSNHTPLEEEAKKLEFPYADYGAIGLETSYAAIQSHLGKLLSSENFVQLLAIAPREILRLSIPKVVEGEPANLTLFDPKAKWVFSTGDIRSRSRNTPFLGETFTGKVLGVIKGKEVYLND